MTKPDPAKIIVPRKHGQVLIEPPLHSQAQALAAPFPQVRGNNPFGENFPVLRRLARQQFLAAARAWAQEIGHPAGEMPADAMERRWVLTGHQVEFYHAGVWAKVLAADELARRCPPVDASRAPAIAFDLLVDHDVLDELGFDLPVQSGESGDWSRAAVTFAEPPSLALPAENVTAPSPQQFLDWDARLARFPSSHTDSLAFFLSALRVSGERAPSYPRWMSAARSRFEASMGLRVHHIPTSLLCQTESWFAFVNAWIDQAPRATALYNTHLAAYRRRQDIRNPQHPMPDLVRQGTADGGTFELPFWVYRKGESRERLQVRYARGRRLVLLRDEEFDIANGLAPLVAKGWQLRPRALTLTMFVRLFLADLFIHGIGGALYDQITDGILEEWFGILPPYSCVSAAWLLPLARTIPEEEDIASLRWRRHYAQHNPQLAIDPFTALRTDVAELIAARRELVDRISRSLETARRDPDARLQRRSCFDQLHAINDQLHARVPRLLANLDRQIADARHAAEQNKVLLWREYFFALHPTGSLRQLIERVRTS